MPQLDLEKTLRRIKENQWALADIDWDAPGREMITEEQWPKLKAFMADLTWIEHIGARGFAAMAKKAPNDTLKEIYTWFHAEEQRHANAELALMQRWGMLEDGEIPEPNINLRLTIEWLDKYSDDMPLNVLGSVIPMLEVTLDGALCKFLLDEVKTRCATRCSRRSMRTKPATWVWIFMCWRCWVMGPCIAWHWSRSQQQSTRSRCLAWRCTSLC